jgi:hypothetical protein
VSVAAAAVHPTKLADAIRSADLAHARVRRAVDGAVGAEAPGRYAVVVYAGKRASPFVYEGFVSPVSAQAWAADRFESYDVVTLRVGPDS